MVYQPKSTRPAAAKSSAPGPYDPVECPDCHEVTVPHRTVGESCPAVIAKAKRLVGRAQSGDADAIIDVMKLVGAERAAELMNPHLGGDL